MTADQIRELAARSTKNNKEENEIGILIVAEIAAQLAELNTRIGKLEYLADNVINLNHGGVQVRVNEQ